MGAAWPGKKFVEGSKEFNMLLGSPVGMTLAYMILQHKAELGVKHMTDVTVPRQRGVPGARGGEGEGHDGVDDCGCAATRGSAGREGG